MTAADRGPLLYAYRPIPANPMTVALLLLVLVVTFLIGPIAAGPEGLWPLGGFCFLPLGVLLVAMTVYKPSPTFVFEDGIEISLPLWRRILGERRYYAWSEIRDVYPRSYEVAGSFLSPFASSAGTLVQTGIGLETTAGRPLLIRFTPGSIQAFRAETQGFVDAMTVIRDRFARHGARMVTTARAFSDAEVLAMQARAREPLVSIVGVFLAFFLPPSIVAAILLVATAVHAELTTPLIGIALAIALFPPAASMARTLRQSERRNALLSELAKYQEHLREDAGATFAESRAGQSYP
ncbi:MAG TPA: hypothetical protein VEO20_02405 [Thermoplasmata archaeon]|nr:hypothetical protein [Thermoplasmata archaeon]